MKVEIIGRTILKDETNENLFEPKVIREDLTLLAGKAAGICYMKDDYLSDGIQNKEKCLTRAAGTAKRGHYSTYEHGTINLLIECNKMVAMVLNSMGLYCTSEKSARYTKMNPETELESEIYEKWIKKFSTIISAYNDKLAETAVEKLAMENARYMLSIFTPTVMMYSVPFNRLILSCQWLDKISDYFEKSPNSNAAYNTHFSAKLLHDLREISSMFKSIIDSSDDTILEDHKNMIPDFFNFMNEFEEGVKFNIVKDEYYGDVYVSNYQASFAELAQAQRHRTLRYQINNINFGRCFVPKIIKGTNLEDEWNRDFANLENHNIVPQCTLLDISEQGRFEEFYLKCKERLCNRAQLEICDITSEQVKKFYANPCNLSDCNYNRLKGMVADYREPIGELLVKPRCLFNDYTCKESCGNPNLRFRNV